MPTSNKLLKYPEETPAFWQEHFKRFATLALSRKAYCRQQGLNYDRFQYWFYKLNKANKANRKNDQAIRPIPVKVSAEKNNTALCCLQVGDQTSLSIYDHGIVSDLLSRLL